MRTSSRKGWPHLSNVACALFAIRERRLYRATHATFERYRHDHLDIGRSYASRLVGAGERLKLLLKDSSLPKPMNENQIRPFLRLPAAEFPTAWKRALKMANEGKLTPRVLKAVVHEMVPSGEVRVRSNPKRNLSKSKLPLGQILALLQETKARVERGQTDEALAALVRIENVLCGA